MSDYLVKRLRDDSGDWLTDLAADRIEELEDKLNWVIVERDETFALMLDRAQTAEAKLAKAVEALKKLRRRQDCLETFDAVVDEIVTTTLAELKGDPDAKA